MVVEQARQLALTLQEPQHFEPYRNIPTCYPSEDLFDDLVDAEDFDILHYAVDQTSGIDAKKPSWHRFESYGDVDDSMLCFKEQWWSVGRFSNGQFGVWYGALDEETSILETSKRPPYIDENDFANTLYPLTQTRRLFRAQARVSRWVNLQTFTAEYPQIIDNEDHSFCQDLGSRAKSESIEMFLSPSVRNPGGICSPIFTPSVIESDKILRYYMVQWEPGDIEGKVFRSMGPVPA